MPDDSNSPLLQEILEAVRNAYDEVLGCGPSATTEDRLLRVCLDEIRESFVGKRSRADALYAAQLVLAAVQQDVEAMSDALALLAEDDRTEEND